MKISFLLAPILLLSCLNKDEYNPGPTQEKEISRMTELTIENRRRDFGLVPPDTLLTNQFFIVNTGKYDLIVDYVNPDCSCITYNISQRKIAPKDTALLTLRLSTKGQSGAQRLYTTLSANTMTKLYSLEMLADVK